MLFVGSEGFCSTGARGLRGARGSVTSQGLFWGWKRRIRWCILLTELLLQLKLNHYEGTEHQVFCNNIQIIVVFFVVNSITKVTLIRVMKDHSLELLT